MLTITKEKQLQEHLIENFSEHFDFQLIASEVVISTGRIDLLGEDDNNIYIVELKRDEVNEFTIIQLSTYIEPIQKLYPNKNIIAIAAAPEIDKRLDIFNLPLGIKVKTIEGVRCDTDNITKVAGLRNRKRLATSIDADLSDKFKSMSEQSRVPMSKLLDEAIEDLIAKRDNLADKR